MRKVESKIQPPDLIEIPKQKYKDHSKLEIRDKKKGGVET
jgi:hypothetical protein